MRTPRLRTFDPAPGDSGPRDSRPRHSGPRHSGRCRPGRRRLRFRGTVLAAVASLLAVSALPAAAAEGLLSVEAEPQVVVAGEPVVLTLVLRSSCLVDYVGTTVAPTASVDPEGAPWRVEVEVDLGCILDPPVEDDYRFFTEPLALPAGDLEVRVKVGETLLPDAADLHVLPPSRVVVEPAAPPFTDAAPVVFEVTGPAVCGELTPPARRDDVFAVTLDENCIHILPPGLLRGEVDLGLLPPGGYELHLFEELLSQPRRLVKVPFRVYDADGCLPTEEVPCLGEGRFEVRAAWFDADLQVHDATPILPAGRDDTVLFWFFDEDNVELTVRVLDGCAVNGHYWVFIAPGTTLEHAVQVFDPATHRVRDYFVEPSPAPLLTADTAAFTCR